MSRPHPLPLLLSLALSALLLVGPVGCSDDGGSDKDETDAGQTDAGQTDATADDAGADGAGVDDADADDATQGDAGGDDGGGADAGSADVGGAVDLGLDPLCSPFSMGNDCLTPWPSVFHTKADAEATTGRRLNYSNGGFKSPDGELPVNLGIFNDADGVSPVSPLFVNLGRDVDPTQLWGPDDTQASLDDDGPILLVDLDTGTRVPLLTEMDMNNRDLGYQGRHALVIRPLAPLAYGKRYAVGILNTLRDTDDKPFDVPPAFAALRDGTITTDERIEASRTRFADVFAGLKLAGVEADELLVAWEVPVASEDQVMGPIRSMRKQAAALNAAGVPYQISEVIKDPTEHAWRIVKGTFQPPNFLQQDNTLAFAGGEVVLQDGFERPSYPFTLYLPAEASTTQGDGLPLVVLGHGLFGQGEGLLVGGAGEELVQPGLASLPAAAIATNWIGLSGGDLQIILNEVVPDIGRIEIVTDRLAQSLVNNLTLIELAMEVLTKDASIGWEGHGKHLDRSKTWYYGNSLGGIQGASFTGISPDVSRSVLAVPGAGWSTMFQRSIHYGVIKSAVDVLYPDPLSQSVYLAMLQTFFDRSDPAGLSRSLADNPSKLVLLQEGVGDVQVPNVATDLLVRCMGAHHLDHAPRPIPGVEIKAGPTQGPALTQYLLPDNLANYKPPTDNTVPTEENFVHGEAPTTAEALAQLLHLVGAGEAKHLCDGPCDPK